MVDRVGQQLGNYHLVHLLGRGGFAEVYLGEHVSLKSKAAIKVLLTELTSNDIEKFRTEAQIIANLIHPHIVLMLEYGVENGVPFLVMDYAPNGTLRQHHPKGSCLSIETVVSYVKQVAAALQYAHKNKLIHRDVKPENMLLGENHKVLLSDFGIAIVSQSSSSLITQNVSGTVPYMAPEQIRGKPRPASDQYSLGVAAYEWLCGVRPFHGSLTEIATQHIFAPPPPLHEKVPTIPSTVEEVVMTALAKDPKQRFANVQDFAIAFEGAAQRSQQHASASPFSGHSTSSEVSLPLNVSSIKPSRDVSSSQPEIHFQPNSEINEAHLIFPASFPNTPPLTPDAASSPYQGSASFPPLANQQPTDMLALPSQVPQPNDAPPSQDQFRINPVVLPGQPISSTDIGTQQLMHISHSQQLLQQYPQPSQDSQQLTGYQRPHGTSTASNQRGIARNIALIFLLLVLILGGVASYFIVELIGKSNTGNTQQLRAANTGTSTPLSTPTVQDVHLGWPVVNPPITDIQKADATTFYTVTIQTVDQSINSEHGYPVHAAGITCKLWLTKDSNVTGNLEASNSERLKSVNTINQPFPGEIIGALNFDPSTQQVQLSDANGQATWKYTISTSVDPGDYYLVVLADWQGKHYNWYWVNIVIKKAV